MGGSRQIRRIGARACIAAGAACLSIFPAGAAADELRPADPVVLTGADTPSLLGSAPNSILAFRRTAAGAWQQIPVQVDERAVVSFKGIYNDSSSSLDVSALQYTDPGTFTGPDPDPTLDADDEIALMARDAGVRDFVSADPPDTTGPGLELRITDPLDPDAVGYVYLYRGTGVRDPAAGRSYVDYNFGLTSGDYKTTYHRGVSGSPNGPNPENSSVTTPFYSDHYSDRWVQDGIQITTPGSSGVDILDRHKNLFAPGFCGRSEDTFSAAEGAFIINKSGPVRAIRGYVGANSGPLTQRVEVFYDRRQDIRTDLRVHQIGTVMDFFDYSPASAGMTYRNALNPLGVTIDGIPDNITAGPTPFEQVSGPQGGMSIVSGIDTDMAITLSSYYLDDSSPSVTQCTGDSASYGSSGSYVTAGIANTDPRLADPHHLSTDRILFFEPPSIAADQAQKRAGQIAYPLKVTEAAPPAPKAHTKIRLRRYGHRRIFLTGSICPGGGRPPVARLERRARNGAFRPIRRLRVGRGKSCWRVNTRLSRRRANYRVAVAENTDLLARSSRVISIRTRRQR